MKLDPSELRVRSSSAPEHEEFSDLMAEQLRRTPWLALSVLIHAIAVLLVMLIPAESVVEKTTAVAVERTPEDEVIPDEVPPEDKIEQDEPVEPELQDPTLEDVPTEDDILDLQDPLDAVDEPVAWNEVGLMGAPSGLRAARKRGKDGLAARGGRDINITIDRGLKWLKDHQDEDGRWDADQFMKHDTNGEPCDGAGNPVHDVGLTGLALLAFLGDGSTMRSGAYRDQVRKAVIWLRDQQDETGLFGSSASHDFIYNHTIAALAMTEAYGLSDYKLLRKPAQRGLNYLESHRNPYMVWRYRPGELTGDSSVTGWCVMVYKTGRDFGLDVNARALKLCGTWFDQVTDPITGQCGYTERGEPSSRHKGDHGVRFPPEKGDALTAVGLMSRFFLEQDPREVPVMTRAADHILTKPPVWDETTGTIDHYYWYYATYALYQMGGRHWREWCKKLTPAVVKTQRQDGNYNGSWNPVGVWGEDGGRVYSTAMLVLTLEAYYRYTRVFVR